MNASRSRGARTPKEPESGQNFREREPASSVADGNKIDQDFSELRPFIVAMANAIVADMLREKKKEEE